ncbi:MAG: hypothetical protein JWM16_5352 [Verrucomicrobiales bacterium]|nr:hypothetical protein [Verrucomicrobiales bacterium]
MSVHPRWLSGPILLLLSSTCFVQAGRPGQETLPDIERRSPHSTRPDAAQAAEKLRGRLPHAVVDWAPITSSPQWVGTRDGFLTGPDGKGRGVTDVFRARQRNDDPHRAVKAFVDEHSNLFGHDSSALAGAPRLRDYVTGHNGLRTTVWQQEHAGLEIFEAVFLAHITKDNELVNISSHFLPKFSEAAQKVGNQPQPTLTARQALILAAQHLGQAQAQDADLDPLDQPADAQRKQQFRASFTRGPAHVRLVWLPVDESTLRLCWEVALKVRTHPEVYRLLLDAQTGEVLLRRCQTTDISNASYRVFTGDSPTPMSPGYAAPGNPSQPSAVSRSLVTLSAISLNASPNGWINDGVNETRGNNIDASTDLDADDVLDLPRPQGSPSRVFDFTLSLAQGPTTYSKAAVVNLFYWCNWAHDKLYDLGFNEAAGNFQVNNFGKGGLGNDAVRAEAQDGEGTRNANFNYFSAADGQPAWIQMYLWPDATPDRDGDLDAQIMLHEYTHGLSARLVGGGVGLSGTQPKGMGEGWSDFYALALLSKSADPLGANYPVGGYATRDFKYTPSAVPFTNNYYFGIRRYPFSTNLAANPLTFQDIDPTQEAPHSDVPRGGVWPNWSAEEVHSVGEVWCAMLWEVRAALVGKLGFSIGNQLTLQIVTDGMKLSPANPNFVQARDAIIQAEQVLTTGTNKNELWIAFAKRGLGFEAIAPPSGTTIGVVESYSVPDALRISPLTNLKISGAYGGPFSLAPQVYTLSNSSASSISWSATANSPLLLSATSGTLASHAKQTMTVSLNNAAANALPIGVQQSFVHFSNQVSKVTMLRKFTFNVSEPLLLLPANQVADEERLRGPAGGPFKLVFVPVVLTNRSSIAIPWNANVPEPFAVSPASGTLAGFGSVQLVAGVTAAGPVLPEGSYTNTMVVSNLTTGAALTRTVELEILNDSFLTQAFYHDGTFNLNKQSLTFIPDGSPEFYAVCRESVAGFPTDPTGGTQLHQDAYSIDDQAEVLLTGGKKVSLYGFATNRLNVNLNGSISFGVKDSYVDNVIVDHFKRLRVSGLFSYYSSYNSLDAGVDISWKQLADRLAVTWQNVASGYSFINESNSFQVEMFFNGQIRITIVNAINPWGVVGLSAGTNLPPDFLSTDFSAFGSCANVFPKLVVTGPSNLTEGSPVFQYGSVHIPTPRQQNLLVNLTSSDTTEITVSPSVTIPAGATSAVFNIFVVNDAIFDGTKGSTITASAQFSQNGSFSILVNDNEVNTLSVKLPASLTEGGAFGTGTVSTKFPVGDNVLVNLQSTQPEELTLGFLPVAFIPAGATSANFTVSAVDDLRIDGTQIAGVIASVPNWISGTNFTQVLDNESINLQIYTPIFLTEGMGTLSNVGEVRISGTLTTNLEVALSSDAFFSLFPLGPITIPAGQTNAFFDLFVFDNATIDPLRFVILTAAAPGFVSGQWSVFLFDNDGPPEALFPSPPDLADNVSRDADLAWGPKEGELIKNGGFELLLANWTREDLGAGGWVNGTPSYNPPGIEGPQSALAGSSFALSQQYGNGRHTLGQEVFIPDGAWPITLSWAQRVHNNAPAFAANQQFRVELRDTDNAVLATLFTNKPGDTLLSDWTNHTADVSAFHGQTVRVAFVEQDALGALNVSLDNVSLIATPAAPTTWLVYMGIDSTPDDTEYLGSTTNTFWTLSRLATNTTYYWQVKSVRAGQTNAGPIWQFNTIAIANIPPSIGLGLPASFTVMRAPTNVLISLRSISDDGFVTKVEYYGDGGKIGQTLASPWSFTWTNPPPGEHTIQAIAQDNGGLRSTSAVNFITILPANGALMTLVPFGSVWRYYDGGANLGTAWRSSIYSDRAWSRGPAQLGYGEGDEATVLDFGSDPNAKYITSYFRNSFSVPPGAQSLQLKVLRDDGVAVYIDGNEVLRDNLPAGAGYHTLASADIFGLSESVLVTGTASPTNLTGRSHIIAAEVHQASSNSVDLSFDLELSAVVNLQPTISLIAPAPNSLYVLPATPQLTAAVQDPYGAVAKVEFFADGTSLGTISNAPFTLIWSNALAGAQVLSAIVTDDLGSTNRSAGVAITIVGASPLLSVAYSPDQTLLSWPAASSGYRVEGATNLSPPVTWMPITNAPITLNGNVLQAAIPTNGQPQQFFRLVAP